MSKSKGSVNKYSAGILWLVVFVAVVYLIVRNIGAFGNLLVAMIGFGTMVLAHEFGHFIFAKMSNIKVEAFWIFAPPMLLGVRRSEKGIRFRILPKFFPKDKSELEEGGLEEVDKLNEGKLNFTVGREGKAGETEYRIGLIPFGGFVKMLGQEDMGSAKKTDNPRSYVNKPVSTRMAVIGAGVFFNAVSAVVLLMLTFLIGIKLAPAVVGGVAPGSPAARAGLRAGDEIIEIDGKSEDLDFGDIKIAAALSDVNEAVKMRVKHEDESIEDFAIASVEVPGGDMREFGIRRPASLTIGKVSDAEALLERTGLVPGDRIKAVNGKDVGSYWELAEIVENCFLPQVTLLVERIESTSDELELVESSIRLALGAAQRPAETKSTLGDIYSMVPRLKITDILDEQAEQVGSSLQSGDVILAIGDVENPIYEEMREVVTEYKDRELPIKVLRTSASGVEETIAVTVVPRWSKAAERVMIGVGISLDFEHAVVAKTVCDQNELPPVPRGAAITAVDGVDVSSFYDIASQINQRSGQRITLDWRIDDEIAGDFVLDLSDLEESAIVKSGFAEFVPFEELQKLYKATGPINAIAIGYKKTIMFIVQTYVTIQRVIGGNLSPKNLMGPVGIITLSYRIVADHPLIYYVYFIGLINACIAVVNLLPLLPFDGGHLVFLLIEKIKGSALNERIQGGVAYVGWVLVGALFLYVTFNDVVRSFFS